MIKINNAGARVETSVPLVSLADLAEGKDTLDFDTLLGLWMHYSKAVGFFCIDDLKVLSTGTLWTSISKTLNIPQFGA